MRLAPLVLALLLSACNRDPLSWPGTDAGADLRRGADLSTFADLAGIDCQAIEDRLAKETALVGTCTTVVRVDGPPGSLAPTGFAIFCGGYAQASEAAARKAAQAATGLGTLGAALEALPMDEWVFWKAPSPDVGSYALVSARNGLTVAGGAIDSAYRASIAYPSAWRPVAELGLGCGPPETGMKGPEMRGWDTASGKPLDVAALSPAVEAVWATALPEALWRVAYIFDVVVVRVSGAHLEAPDPWLVLVNSGWLE